jgi:hypothetical protein
MPFRAMPNFSSLPESNSNNSPLYHLFNYVS